MFGDGWTSSEKNPPVHTYTSPGDYTVSLMVSNAYGYSTAYQFINVTTAGPDLEPPMAITNLRNTTFSSNFITWEWTDPTDADFDKVIVYCDEIFQANVSKGNQIFTLSGLTQETEYTIGTRTVDTSGNVNETWVNNTARTESTPISENHPPILNIIGSKSVNEGELLQFTIPIRSGR